MERLLVIKLDVRDCEAEVLLNGVAVARASAARPRAVVPVHEYTLSGANRLELVIWPAAPVQPPGAPPLAPLPLVADGIAAASVRVLLPRVGSPIDESDARTLGQIDWGLAAGTAYQAPQALQQDITLPVSFPRWRWLDAPLVEASAALNAQALAWLQPIAAALAAGDSAPFLAATRLRCEELALAYQRRPEDEVQRLREHLAERHAAGVVPQPLAEGALLLRPLAGGRLHECLSPEGLPALCSAADALGQTHGWPLRVACVDGRFYGLR